MCPEGPEGPFPVMCQTHTEQVLQPSILQGIALHVKKHVSGIWHRHTVEAAPQVSVQRKYQNLSLAGLTRVILQRCLRLQPGKRLCLKVRNRSADGNSSQVCE